MLTWVRQTSNQGFVKFIGQTCINKTLSRYLTPVYFAKYIKSNVENFKKDFNGIEIQWN